MAKKKKQARKSFKVKTQGKPSSSGTPVLGQVMLHYVQFAIPEAYASDVGEAMGQQILSDIQRAYLRDRQSEF